MAQASNFCIICGKATDEKSDWVYTFYADKCKHTHVVHARCIPECGSKLAKQEQIAKPQIIRVYDICRGDGKVHTEFHA
jgi:hypothetical protein